MSSQWKSPRRSSSVYASSTGSKEDGSVMKTRTGRTISRSDSNEPQSSDRRRSLSRLSSSSQSPVAKRRKSLATSDVAPKVSNKEVTSEKKAAEQGGDDNRCEKGAESDNKSRSASVEIETASYSSKCGNTGDVEERTDMVKSGNTASSTGNNESGKEYTSTGKAGNEVDKGNTVTDKTEDDRGGQEAGLPNKTGCSVTPALSSSARKLPEHGETANQGAADKDAGPANQGQKENPENKSTNKSVDSVADPVHEPSPTSSQEMPFNEDKDRNQPKTSAATEPPSPAKSIPSPGRKTPKSANEPVLIGGKPREFIIRTRAGARGSSSAPRQPAITVSAVKVWRDKEPSTRPAAKRVVVPRVGKSVAERIAEEGSVAYRSKRSSLEGGPAVRAPVDLLDGSQRKKLRTVVKGSDGKPEEKDYYCWVCHKEGPLHCCELCPRAFHLRCVNMASEPPADWVCPECDQIMKAECMETRSKAMTLLTMDQLCLALRYVIHRMSYAGSEPFQSPVDLSLNPAYPDYIVNPMDLSVLEENRKQKNYGSTEAFLADAKWIHHNSIVFNGVQNKLTQTAKTMLKVCRYETSEIEVCPDCFMNSFLRRNENWFCEPCRTPHTLVWAKMKGYPYWPGKVLRIDKHKQVDVRFFGEHDRAWVPLEQTFMLSRHPPQPLKKNRMGFKESCDELAEHIHRIQKQFGTFRYAPNSTPYKPEFDPVCGGRPQKIKKKSLGSSEPVNYQIQEAAGKAASVSENKKTQEVRGKGVTDSGVKSSVKISSHAKSSPMPEKIGKASEVEKTGVRDCSVKLSPLRPEKPQSALAQTASKLLIKYCSMASRQIASTAKLRKSARSQSEERSGSMSPIPMETAVMDDQKCEKSVGDGTQVEEMDEMDTEECTDQVEQAAEGTASEKEAVQSGVETPANLCPLHGETEVKPEDEEPGEASPVVSDMVTKKAAVLSDDPPPSGDSEGGEDQMEGIQVGVSETAQGIYDIVEVAGKSHTGSASGDKSPEPLSTGSSVQETLKESLLIGSTKSVDQEENNGLDIQIISVVGNVSEPTIVPLKEESKAPDAAQVQSVPQSLTEEHTVSDVLLESAKAEEDAGTEIELQKKVQQAQFGTTPGVTDNEAPSQSSVLKETSQKSDSSSVSKGPPVAGRSGASSKGVFTATEGRSTKEFSDINLSLPPLSTKVNVPKPKLPDPKMMAKIQTVLKTREEKTSSPMKAESSSDPQVSEDDAKSTTKKEKAENEQLEEAVVDNAQPGTSRDSDARKVDLALEKSQDINAKVKVRRDTDEMSEEYIRPEEDLTPTSSPMPVFTSRKRNSYLENIVESCWQKLRQENSTEEEDESDDDEESSEETSGDTAEEDGGSSVDNDGKAKENPGPSESTSTMSSQVKSSMSESVLKGNSTSLSKDCAQPSTSTSYKDSVKLSSSTSNKDSIKPSTSTSHKDSTKTSTSTSKAADRPTTSQSDSDELRKLLRKPSSGDTSDSVPQVVTKSTSSTDSTCKSKESPELVKSSSAGVSVIQCSASAAKEKSQLPVVTDSSMSVDSEPEAEAGQLVIDLDKSKSGDESAGNSPSKERGVPHIEQTSNGKRPRSSESDESSRKRPRKALSTSLRSPDVDMMRDATVPAAKPLGFGSVLGCALPVPAHQSSSSRHTSPSSESHDPGRPEWHSQPIMASGGPGPSRSGVRSPQPAPIDLRRSSQGSEASAGEPAASDFMDRVQDLDMDKYMAMAKDALKGVFDSMCKDLLQKEAKKRSSDQYQKNFERLKWSFQQELSEIKHNAELTVTEMHLSWLSEKKKMMSEFKNILTKEKKKAVSEAKSKQWCANCGDEAQFYCCWNTSYCNYPCQQEHWPKHMQHCAQASNVEKPSGDTASSDRTTASQSLPANSAGLTVIPMGVVNLSSKSSTTMSSPSSGSVISSYLGRPSLATAVTSANKTPIQIIPSGNNPQLVSPGQSTGSPNLHQPSAGLSQSSTAHPQSSLVQLSATSHQPPAPIINPSLMPLVRRSQPQPIVYNIPPVPSSAVQRPINMQRPINVQPNNPGARPINVQPIVTGNFPNIRNEIPQGGMPGMANPMMQHQAALFQQPPHNMMFLNMNPQGGAPGMIPMRGNPSLVPMGNAQAGTMIYRPNFNP